MFSLNSLDVAVPYKASTVTNTCTISSPFFVLGTQLEVLRRPCDAGTKLVNCTQSLCSTHCALYSHYSFYIENKHTVNIVKSMYLKEVAKGLFDSNPNDLILDSTHTLENLKTCNFCLMSP